MLFQDQELSSFLANHISSLNLLSTLMGIPHRL